jgi:CubicO group peptidase (beta-lactamase class C family)
MRVKSWLRAILATLPLALAGCHSGQPDYLATREAARAVVQSVMADTGAASVSVALVDSRGLVWAEAFGQEDRSAGTPATPASLYGACSVSKMLATVAVMILADQGRVALDAPVATYLPGFSMPLDARFRDITVRMLLDHSSGLPTDDRHSVTAVANPGYGAEVLAGTQLQRLAHAPGLISSYNNEGFTLVEALVAAVSGQDYPAFVRQRILLPLGMDTSQYMDAPLPAAGPRRRHPAAGLCLQHVRLRRPVHHPRGAVPPRPHAGWPGDLPGPADPVGGRGGGHGPGPAAGPVQPGAQRELPVRPGLGHHGLARLRPARLQGLAEDRGPAGLLRNQLRRAAG